MRDRSGSPQAELATPRTTAKSPTLAVTPRTTIKKVITENGNCKLIAIFAYILAL